MKKITLFSSTLLLTVTLFAQQFTVTWNVTENPLGSGEYNITIPTNPGNQFTYNYEVDWDNDGVFDISGVTGDVTHNFGSAGSKSVKIQGTFPAIFFKNSEDKTKITAITDWGGSSFGWESFAFAFSGCTNLNSLPSSAPDLSFVEDMSYMFQGASSLNSSLNNWDVSGVEYMIGTFSDATSFNGDISSWNVSSVKDMTAMFSGATDFNVDISNWTTTALLNMSNLFANASTFNQSFGSNWNTSSVTNMDGVFLNATSFNQEINWNTSSVTSMRNMFNGASFFNKVLDFNIESTTNMNYMLSGSGLSNCKYQLTLAEWNSGSVQSGVTLGAHGLFYTNTTDRSNLTGTNSWTIEGDDLSSGDVCRDPSWFQTTWQINDGTEITIPTKSGYMYNYDVDWNGDGEFDVFGVTGDATYTYPIKGGLRTEDINIRGNFPSIRFDNLGDKDLLLSINQWGEIEWESFESSFRGCSNLTYKATDTPNLNNVTSLKRTFYGCSIFNGDIGNWDVSEVTDMSGLFNYAHKFNQNIGGWDVSKVTDMSNMFYIATDFDQNLGSWKLDNLTNTSSMFVLATSFDNDGSNSIDNWDMHQVTTTRAMFDRASSFNRDISSWIVNEVSDMSFMFSGASLFNQDIGSWNTGKVTTMKSMFNYAHRFNQNIGGWDVSKVTDMSNMFYIATDFDQNLGSWKLDNLTNTSSMFVLATSFDNDGSNSIDNWDMHQVTTTRAMFDRASSFNRDISSWIVNEVSDMSFMFSGASLFNQDIGSWNTGKVTTMKSMFNSASDFDQDIGDWNVRKVEDMSNMFYIATDFDQDLSEWKLDELKNARSMFLLATSFNNGANSGTNNVSINNWDMDQVTDMNGMFDRASSFNRNIGDWDLSGIPLADLSTAMANMLNYCGMGYNAYDNTLIGWYNNANTPDGIALGAQGLYYCDADLPASGSSTSLYVLFEETIANGGKNWNITDAGKDCNATARTTAPKTNSTLVKVSTTNLSPTNQITINSISNGNLKISQTKPGWGTTTSVKIYDMQGKVVYQGKQNSSSSQTFSLGTVAKGIYSIKVMNGSAAKTQKVALN